MLSEEQVRSQLNTDQMDQTDLQHYLKKKGTLALLKADLKTMVYNKQDYNREQYVEHIHGMLKKCNDLVKDMQNIADQEVQLQLTNHIQQIEVSLSALLLLDESFLREARTPHISAIFSGIKSIRSFIKGKSNHDFNTMPAEIIDTIFLQGLLGSKSADAVKFFYNFSLINSRSFSISNRRSNSLLPDKLAALSKEELNAAQMAFVRHDRLSLLQESLEQERNKSDKGLLDNGIIYELSALAIKSGSLRCMEYLCSLRELDIDMIENLLIDAVRFDLKCTFLLLDKLANLLTEFDLTEFTNQVHATSTAHLPVTTLLIEAARQGNLVTVKYLIEHCGAEIDLGCPSGAYDTMRDPTPTNEQPPSLRSLRFLTPLVTALQGGHYEVASYLIDKIKTLENRIFNLSSVIHEVLLQVHITDPARYLNFVHELTSFLERKEMACNYFNQPGKLSRLIESGVKSFPGIDTCPMENIAHNAINQFLDSIEPWMSLFPEEVVTTDFSQVIKLAILSRPQLLRVLANNGVNLEKKINILRYYNTSMSYREQSYSPLELALFFREKRQIASSDSALLLLQSGLTIDFLTAYKILNASILEKNPLLAASSFKCINNWSEIFRKAYRSNFHQHLETGVFLTEQMLEAFIELENPWECIYILQKFPFRQTPQIVKALFDLALKFRSSELINILLKCVLNNEFDMSNELFSELYMEPMLLTDNSLGLLLDLNERSPAIDPAVLLKRFRETGWDNLSELIISRYPYLSSDSGDSISQEACSSMNQFKFFSSTRGIKREFESISLPLEKEEISDEEREEEEEELFGLPPNKKPRGF